MIAVAFRTRISKVTFKATGRVLHILPDNPRVEPDAFGHMLIGVLDAIAEGHVRSFYAGCVIDNPDYVDGFQIVEAGDCSTRGDAVRLLGCMEFTKARIIRENAAVPLGDEAIDQGA